LASTKGERWGKPRTGLDSPYLLSGMGLCALCGASMMVRASSHARQCYYVCANYHHRGATICGNGARLPMALADDEILTKMSGYILDREIVEGAIMDAVQELRPSREAVETTRRHLLAEIRRLDDEQARYVSAIAIAGQIEALAQALKTNEQQRTRLRQDLAGLDRLSEMTTFDLKRIARDLRKRVEDWRGLLTRQKLLARQTLSQLLDGRILWTPRKDTGIYEYRGRVKFDQLLSGIVDPLGGIAVRGFEPRSRG
jgi:site-specific DNA recombinase